MYNFYPERYRGINCNGNNILLVIKCHTQFSIHYLKSRSDLRVFSHRTSFPNSQIYGRFIKSTSFSERRYVGVFTLLRVGVLELDADFRNWKKDIWGTDVHDVEIRYKLEFGKEVRCENTLKSDRDLR
jgi:hypothetical protein